MRTAPGARVVDGGMVDTRSQVARAWDQPLVRGRIYGSSRPGRLPRPVSKPFSDFCERTEPDARQEDHPLPRR
jgi:hypothetical protein